jgi:hypothetical protein
MNMAKFKMAYPKKKYVRFFIHFGQARRAAFQKSFCLLVFRSLLIRGRFAGRKKPKEKFLLPGF